MCNATRTRNGMRRLAALAIAVVMLSGAALGDEKSKGGSMSYEEARDFLATHTAVVELLGAKGARVAICPELQGRVMTSTCGGISGPSFGFINCDFLESGEQDKHFNNYGGEERMWLSPEGGPYSLWFAPGDPQNLNHWFTPPAFNEGAWKITSGDRDPFYRMETRMELSNASGAKLDLGVSRTVRLVRPDAIGALFGEKAAELIAAEGVRMVGYETTNTITNRGPAMTREKGLVSIWILGMMNASPQTVVLVPYQAGSEKVLGPVVKSDYFGEVPPDRLKVLPEAVLFMADGNCRSKIGTSQRRARNVLGSIDFEGGVLTLVQFSMPDDPTTVPYMNNMWGVPQEGQPYEGDVANSYNDGPPGEGKPQMGKFYEIESLSPAAELAKDGSLTHTHRTVHVQADENTVAALAAEVLGVDLDKVRKQMIGK